MVQDTSQIIKREIIFLVIKKTGGRLDDTSWQLMLGSLTPIIEVLT